MTVREEGAGAELQSAEDAGYYHTITRYDGTFRLPLPEGRYRARIDYADFTPVEVADLEIQKVGPSLEVQKIYIEETVGLLSLRGKVVNAAGEPLDNVQVNLKPGGMKEIPAASAPTRPVNMSCCCRPASMS